MTRFNTVWQTAYNIMKPHNMSKLKLFHPKDTFLSVFKRAQAEMKHLKVLKEMNN